MQALPIKGRCLCGDVRYHAEGSPIWVAHCHCASCRRSSGSAVATFVAFEKRGFELTEGQFAAYESSPGVRRLFCGRCGTPMAYEADRREGEIHVLLGTLNNPQDFPVNFHVCFNERLPWLELQDDAPRHPEFP